MVLVVRIVETAKSDLSCPTACMDELVVADIDTYMPDTMPMTA